MPRPARNPHKHPMRERFCQEVLKDGLPNPAAKRAGYTGRNAGTILMGLEDVQRRVKALFQSQMRRLQMSADDVVIGLSRIARFDARKLFDQQGSLLQPHEWPDEVAMCVSSLEVEQRWEGKGENAQSYRVHKIKLNDRLQALVALARTHNLFAEEARSVGEGLSGAMAELVQRAQQDGGGVGGLLAAPKPQGELEAPVATIEQAPSPVPQRPALPLPRRNPFTLQ